MKGDILLAINGQETQERLMELVSLKSTNTMTWAREEMAKQILVFPGSQAEGVELLIAKADGRVTSAVLPLLNVEEIQKPLPTLAEINKVLGYRFLEQEKAGHLIIRTCMDREYARIHMPWMIPHLEKMGIKIEDVPEMESLCSRFFAEMKERGYENLIIDLQGNGGGSDHVPEILMKYLTQGLLRSHFPHRQLKVSQASARMAGGAELGTLLDWETPHLEYPYQSRLNPEELAQVRPFTGKVLVLIDGRVFSSGESLASLLRVNNLGTFIGTPTGNGGNRPGEQVTIKLPHSQLPLGISCKFFQTALEGLESQLGVIPEYYVPQTIADLREGRSTALEYALDLLQESKEQVS